jgi:drug/metabolite transporter (DMT)-like permease
MLPPASLLGVLFALTSAAVWGGGDFTGGLATRRSSQFHVLALASLSGMAVLLVCVLLWRESFPSWRSIVWAALAGASGAIGIAALYRALSLGHAATVAPTAAVISAAMPVGFSALMEGLPAPARLSGFVLAFTGIWLVTGSLSAGDKVSRLGLLLACLAGVGFGGFFILLGQVEPGKVFTPLLIARWVAFCAALLMIRVYRLSLPTLTSNPTALLAGVLDAGGNIFYLLARQFVRLDVAAVLASLYPVSTVLLARAILHETISRSQWAGVVICLMAIALITV